MLNDRSADGLHPHWTIAFDRYDPNDEGRREVIAALGNGLFVTRSASTDARQDDVHYPGTYHAGCYNRLPNIIEGERDETESLVNLPNWLPLSFRIDGGPWFSLDHVEVLDYLHELDMRTGTALRAFRMRDALGRHTQVRESRLVSMDNPRLCAIRYQFTPLDWSGKVEFRSALEGDVLNLNVQRYEDYSHLHLVDHASSTMSTNEAILQCSTSHSRIRIAQAMRTVCSESEASIETVCEKPSTIAHIIRIDAECGKEIRIEKTVALGTSLDFKLKDP